MVSLNKSETWKWKNWEISWSLSKESTSEKNIKILLIHGFGASKKHWRHNQDFLGQFFDRDHEIFQFSHAHVSDFLKDTINIPLIKL